jgi:hypothetical protein
MRKTGKKHLGKTEYLFRTEERKKLTEKCCKRESVRTRKRERKHNEREKIQGRSKVGEIKKRKEGVKT